MRQRKGQRDKQGERESVCARGGEKRKTAFSLIDYTCGLEFLLYPYRTVTYGQVIPGAA